jgi:anti-sigma regulatory factor (Ser/Thr protein kinase)
MSAGAVASSDQARAFRHEALLYEGLDAFVETVSSFVRDGAAQGEPALVVVDQAKISLLRDAVGDTDGVVYADMARVGTNPGRIISAWRDFVAEHSGSGRPFRGVGEPVWAARSPAELTECQRHESLLNAAFDGGPAWWLLCPYDVLTLDDAVLEEAEHSHPSMVASGVTRASRWYREAVEALEGALDEPPFAAVQMPFAHGSNAKVRQLAERMGQTAGLSATRTDDLMVAVSELASNSIRHGGGHGTLRVWEDGGALVCEVRDEGRIEDPLVGRARPIVDSRDGRGLWLVHQLCDLVQIRSGEAGTTIRIHMQTR